MKHIEKSNFAISPENKASASLLLALIAASAGGACASTDVITLTPDQIAYQALLEKEDADRAARKRATEARDIAVTASLKNDSEGDKPEAPSAPSAPAGPNS